MRSHHDGAGGNLIVPAVPFAPHHSAVHHHVAHHVPAGLLNRASPSILASFPPVASLNHDLADLGIQNPIQSDRILL